MHLQDKREFLHLAITAELCQEPVALVRLLALVLVIGCLEAERRAGLAPGRAFGVPCKVPGNMLEQPNKLPKMDTDANVLSFMVRPPVKVNDRPWWATTRGKC